MQLLETKRTGVGELQFNIPEENEIPVRIRIYGFKSILSLVAVIINHIERKSD